MIDNPLLICPICFEACYLPQILDSHLYNNHKHSEVTQAFTRMIIKTESVAEKKRNKTEGNKIIKERAEAFAKLWTTTTAENKRNKKDLEL
jgi:hypothetical protein